MKMWHPFSKVHLGIAGRLGLLLALFGVFASGLTGYYAYITARDLLVADKQQDLLVSTEVLGQRFSTLARLAAGDARQLARNPLSSQVFATQEVPKPERQDLERQFEILLRERPEYLQVRLIDAASFGREMVRVERDGDRLMRVEGLDLQEKGHYSYVFRALAMDEGQVYFSRIFINRERGVHAGMNQPTLQVATPVVSGIGRTLGVIVINVDLNRLFSSLNADFPNEYQLYLANELGDFLVHPDPARTFGFDYGRRFLMQDEFEETKTLIDGKASQVTSSNAAAEDGKGVVGGFLRVPFGDTAGDRHLLLGLTVPMAQVLRGIEPLTRSSLTIVAGFSLLAIVLSWLLSRTLVRPLQKLAQTMRRFSETHEATPVDYTRQDELGQLALSFTEMQRDILAHLHEVYQSKADVEHAAQHDLLTGAPNRANFFGLLNFSIRNARRHGDQVAVLFIDLDHFKEVNDTHGHAAGDAVLIEVVSRLRGCVRENDTVARFGGDEFVLLMHRVESRQEVAVVAEKLIAVMHAPIRHEDRELNIGLSIGISMYPHDGDHAETLLHNADQAMYRSKRAGRNTYHFFDQTSQDKHTKY